jgi:hypothetical protein
MKINHTLGWGLAVALLGSSAVAAIGWSRLDEYKSGVIWPEPPLVTPGGSSDSALRLPPSDATVLFDGTNLDAWVGGDRWEIKDGYAITRQTDIFTKQTFGDCQLHIEFATPEKIEGEGQGRGNSGVYFMDQYEVQVLDSWNNPTYFDGQAASVYKQSPPIVNASREPGQWQEYDIVFTAPRFNEDGSLQSPAYLTVFHNGVLVQNHFALTGQTLWHAPPVYAAHPEKMPIKLQFHGNETRFRNIWVRENVHNMIGTPPQ